MRRLLLLLLPLSGCSCDDGLPAGSACDHGSDCASGLVCPNQMCTASVDCTASAECGAGARCVAGMCEQSTPGSECMVTLECVEGEFCGPGGRCATEVACDENADCGKGGVCMSGACEQNEPGGPCTTSDECIVGETCIGNECVAGCGGELYGADAVPPNLLIVLDRSGSMLEEVGDPPDTKWNIARNAINNFFSSNAGQIRFGLSVYPGTDLSCEQGVECGPGITPVDVGAGTESMITNYMRDSGTCMLRTPTAEMLGTLYDYPGLEDTTRANYILLLTDGMANCDDPVPAVQMLREQMPEVKTFVVGFGDGVDPDQLRDMARAGGTARQGDPEYYQADDAASLRAAFASIAGAVLSCEYTLSAVPPDPDLLYVYFNGRAIPRDMTHAGGWDHTTGTNRLTFYGDECDALQSGQVTQLVIVYGCPNAPPPPPPDAGVPDGGGMIDPTGMGCTSCTQCGTLGCVIPQGETSGTCEACGSDFDCCLGYMCMNGTCVPNL
jgi:hypothetical protein